MKDKVHILLFYKYVKIAKPEKFAIEHLKKCQKLGLMGRILVAEEGINGSVAGSKKQTEAYKRLMRKDKKFKDMQFKEDLGLIIPFRKMVVKVKKEIVTFKQKVDLKNTGTHLTPKQFLDLYKKKEDVIILDARNGYESKVGKFRNAITPDIQKFSDFPKVVKQLKDKKDKKIVMYCTGGIRCEKASAYMKEQGFKDVSQLKGGILTFGKKYPDTVWEGSCFVFDKRLISKVNDDDEPISKCDICQTTCDLCRNCSNPKCDKMIVECLQCRMKLMGCCSVKCMEECKKKKIIRDYTSTGN